MLRILMICTGNICRSPLAHVVLQDCVNKAGLAHDFEIESAGTHGYHIGEDADHRARKTALKHGLTLSHPARKVQASDVDYYDLLLCMDKSHLHHVRTMARNTKEKDKIKLFGTYDAVNPESEVPDPYYGDMSDFETVYQQVLDLSLSMLKQLGKAAL